MLKASWDLNWLENANPDTVSLNVLLFTEPEEDPVDPPPPPQADKAVDPIRNHKLPFG